MKKRKSTLDFVFSHFWVSRDTTRDGSAKRVGRNMVPAHRTVLYAKRREATFTCSASEKRKIDARRRYFHFSSLERDIFVIFRKKSSDFRKSRQIIVFSSLETRNRGVFAFYSVPKRTIYSPAFSRTVRYDGRGPYFKVSRFPDTTRET